MFTYLLELKENKFYIITLENITKEEEILEQLKNNELIKIYPFSKIKNKYKIDNKFEENEILINLMYQYGIENIRGGLFNNIDLSQNEIETIKKQINEI